MSQIVRVLPYVWPYRRKVYLSVAFALLVALFWSLNLTAAFPVVKVLLEGQSLAEWVDAEIAQAESEIAKRTGTIEHLDAQLKQREQTQHNGEASSSRSSRPPGEDLAARKAGDEAVKLLKDRARQQSKLTSATRKALAMSWARSNVIPWLPEDQFDVLALILGLLVLATVLKGLCIVAQEVLVGSVVELTTIGIRKECFRRTLQLDYQTLSLSGTPALMSRFTYDTTMLARGLTLLGGKVIREPLKALCCVVGAFLVSWQLTLLSMLFVPLVGLVFYRIGRKLKLASHRMLESMSRIYKTLEETFEALKVVIAFHGGLRHRQQFHRENKTYYAKAMKIVKIDALTSPTTEVLGVLAAFIALLPGAYLVLRRTDSIWGIKLSSGQMDIAELVLLYMFLAGVIDPVRKLSTTYAKLKRASAAADRIFALIDQEPLVREPSDPKPLPRHSQSIAFRKIHFAYSANKRNGAARPAALDNVNLNVTAGEVVAVVGENGSGKSTLVHLLPRFFDPDHGSVLIDGIDIRDVRLRDLRAQMGIVTQETLLFDETIYENIRYGKRTAGRGEVERAARQAHVAQFVEQLPDGFETRVGEKGHQLSGGQRQRVALARAILRDPAILILDEATSAIDAQSERLIHQTLRKFVTGRTTFLITHSVSKSILDLVTRIVVMEQGSVVAVGPHDELLRTCPAYQRLYHAHVEDKGPSPSAAVACSSVLPSRVNDDSPPFPVSQTQPPHLIPIRIPDAREPGRTVPLQGDD